MHDTKKKLGLTALCLTLVLSLIGAVDGGAAFAEDAEPTADSTTTTTSTTSTTVPAPTTSEAPPTTEAPAPSPEAEEPPTTTAPAPAGPAEEEQAQRPPKRRWGPDPRIIDYGRCGRGITACHVAKAHQRQGKYQWRDGRWFRWGTTWVRGHRGETWPAFQREARLIRVYLYLVAVARHRRNLVNRWSGVANCESGGNWSIATGNGYYGGLQFNLGTWRAYGGQGMPNQRPAWYQATVAERVRTQSGLHHWPHCGAYYG